MSRYWGEWAPYVSVAQRRKKAEREMRKLRGKNHRIAPVVIEARAIARTVWGKAWCNNLKSYRDFESRLPRGRTYVRNGSVVDLQVAPLAVNALVSGSSIYQIRVDIAPMPKARWRAICRDCAGDIDSVVELLQGRLSSGVMERLCRQDEGLFPGPSEIKFSCSCPDYASMCKHVAAALYGVGARLDESPELLFRLRALDLNDLLAQVDASVPLSTTEPAAGKILAGDDISALFGIEMTGGDAQATPEQERTRPKPAKPKTAQAEQPATRPVARRKSDTPAPAPVKDAVRLPLVPAATRAKPARKSVPRRPGAPALAEARPKKTSARRAAGKTSLSD
jgi:uncharacterized Zn finger protein